MALSAGEKAHNFYMRRKLNGLCTRCGKPLDRVGEYCVACLVARNKEVRTDRQWRAENHLCTTCGKFSVPKGQKTCPECKAKIANRRKPKTDAQNREFSAHQRSLYEYRSLNGICTRCGKRKAYAGRKKCKLCLEKDASAHRKISESTDKSRKFWMDNGLCYFCGRPIEDRCKKACNSCRDRMSAVGKKNGGKNKLWRNDDKFVFKNF